jgi:hypothetical protein
MSKSRGPRRKVNYEKVVAYAAKHPTMLHEAIASHFKTSTRTISRILCGHGVRSLRRGRPPKAKSGQTSEQHKWEKILHDAGLGMDRGLRLATQRILYGYDARKESYGDDSATCNSGL